jgi:hypothetical protein
VLAACDETGPIAYLPVCQPFFFDALAVRPGSDAGDVAVAIKQLVHTAVTQAYLKGVGQIYFTANEATAKFADSQGVFEKVPWPLYRLKLTDLENQPCPPAVPAVESAPASV